MGFEDLLNETRPHFGTLVLDGFEVVKLLGVFKDEHDYYYKYIGFERGEYGSSAVMSFTQLKGKIDDAKYQSLVSIWNMNMERRYENNIAV